MSNESASPLGASRPLVPPLVPSSVYTLPSLEALDAIMDGSQPGFIYARDGHPNAQQLAAELANLERADWALICSSGMAAISSIILANLRHGDHIVASNRLYGKTTQLLTAELTKFGIDTTFVDIADLEQVKASLQSRTRMLFVETLSNPMLRLADIPALADIARRQKCLLAVDNTFTSPVLLRPVELGADFAIESLTKMIGGHSDLTLGVIAGRGPLPKTLATTVSTWGFASSAFDCWLASRGLATLELRARQACSNAAELAHWLASAPSVVRIVYPGLPDHPDHATAKKLLGDCFGNMLCFELEGGRSAVDQFIRQAPAIPFSPSLGHTTTTLSHPATTSHRYVPPEERSRQGITDGLIRLSVGIEPLEQIMAALLQGLR